MSVKAYPVTNKGLTLTEIPNHIAVFIEIGGCKNKCNDCHSADYIHIPLYKDLYTPIDELVKYTEKQKALGATAIVIMGGTNNHGMDTGALIALIEELGLVLPVGVYSGLPEGAPIHDYLYGAAPSLRWLKTGEYKAECGGLDNPNTNQKFWERHSTNCWSNKAKEYFQNQRSKE